MSATHRSLQRLPLDIFVNLRCSSNIPPRHQLLQTDVGEEEDSFLHSPQQQRQDDDGVVNNEDIPEILRTLICNKLKDFGVVSSPAASTTTSLYNDERKRETPVSPKKEEKGGVTTVGQLLKLSPPTLLRALDPLLTHHECCVLIKRISASCAATPCTALTLLSSTTTSIKHVSTGISTLDSNLKGGFRIGTLTEVVGRAGVGKTQLALQLCIVAAKYNGGGIYIDTEGKLSLERLREMAMERRKDEYKKSGNDNIGFGGGGEVDEDGGFLYNVSNENEQVSLISPSPLDVQNNNVKQQQSNDQHHYKTPMQVLENTTIHSPKSTQELLSILSTIEDEILIRNEEASDETKNNEKKIYPVKLLILDSIAAPMRKDFGSESAHERVLTLFNIASSLKRIADTFGIAVVIINQVGSLAAHEDPPSYLQNNGGVDGNEADGTDIVAVHAALGTSWHHCVSTRLLLQHERDPHRLGNALDLANEEAVRNMIKMRNHGMDDDEDEQEQMQRKRQAWMSERGHVRTATVVKSNVAGISSMLFEVTTMGVCEIK